jgi:dienelactone hydrolase
VQVLSIESRPPRGPYTVRRLTLGPSGIEHDLLLDYYDLNTSGPSPVVLVLPILGGDNELASHFAALFAKHGLAAVIVHRREEDKKADEIEELNRVLRMVVLDHARAVDWIETRPELDGTRVGLFGISAGAVKGVLVLAMERRIGPAVLALAGGDLPAILATSSEHGIAAIRHRVLAEHAVTADELRRVLEAELRWNPLEHARHIDAANTLLILARFDTVVPYRTGLSLRDAIGGPETLVIPTGHYTAILYLPLVERLATSFLRQRLTR